MKKEQIHLKNRKTAAHRRRRRKRNFRLALVLLVLFFNSGLCAKACMALLK